MGSKKKCSGCGVPLAFSRQQVWHENGVITEAGDPTYRLILVDVDGLSHVFADLEKMLEMPVDHIITEGKRKAALTYLHYMLGGVKGSLVRALARRQAYGMIASLGPMLGYGHYEIRDYQRGKQVTIYGRNIYSIPMLNGDLKATFNVLEGVSAQVFMQVSDGGVIIGLVPGEEGLDLDARISRVVIPLKPGSLHLKRCPACGMPSALKDYEWDVDEGVIVDTVRGCRVAVIEPEGLEAVFRELELELGTDVSQVIMGSYGRCVQGCLPAADNLDDRDVVSRYLAIKGMGKLVAYTLKDGGLEAEVDNAVSPNLLAGIMQGIYELATGRKSTCCRSRSEDGTLAVKVEAAAAALSPGY